MIILNALVAVLGERGILSLEQSQEIRDLHALSVALEGKGKTIFTDEEGEYLEKVQFALREHLYDQVKELDAPESMRSFKAMLVRSVHTIKRIVET